ncbi:MAG: hypothetical protein AAFX02_01960 [Pseudomonadota bacterium]
MNKGIFVGIAVLLLGAFAVYLFAPGEFETEETGVDLSQIDRTDADGVATVFSLAYLTRDLDAIASFMPPRYADQIEDLQTNQEKSEIYQLLYESPEDGWAYVGNINTNLPKARLDREERLYPLKSVGNEMFVLTLAAESDGKWYVQDVHSPDLADFENLPLAE